jgi:hypothetical protein
MTRPPKPPRPPNYREIFDADWGDEEKRKGIDRVYRGKKNRPWAVWAIFLSHDVLLAKEYISADDIWYACWKHDVKPPGDGRAMGAVLRALARDGLIAKVERTRQTERVASHRRPLQVWRSLLYSGNPKRFRPL